MGFRVSLYCLWALIAISLSLLQAGLNSENTTRILVLLLLLLLGTTHQSWVQIFSAVPPRRRFVLLGCIMASLVEGFHMISHPVFEKLRITPELPIYQGLIHYGVDLIFTLPAYALIFVVIWFFINRYTYTFWQYFWMMGLAQTLGDGGLIYFMSSPYMLFFLPYPMSNYHAINLIPFLAVRDQLKPERKPSPKAFLVIPTIIGTYLFCGTIIKMIGKMYGLE